MTADIKGFTAKVELMSPFHLLLVHDDMNTGAVNWYLFEVRGKKGIKELSGKK